MRKYYLDNLRSATVLLVFVYHVFYLFNGVGVLGGIAGAESIPACDALLYVVYPWFMVLLFIIAGMCARYSLQKRPIRQFLRERTRKLLVPSTLGLFALHWVTGYLNIRLGGALDMIPAALLYPICAISGVGPLWFIQLLFLFSLIIAGVKMADRRDVLWTLGGKASTPVILLLGFLIWGSAQVLNTPVLIVYRFGIYFTSFIIGYAVFSHEQVQERIAKMRIPMLVLALCGAIAYTVYYYGSNYTDAACLQSAFTNWYLWIATLAIFGCGKAYFDTKNKWTMYLSKVSFGVYILHYPVLLGVCYCLSQVVKAPAALSYPLALALGLGLTLALFLLIQKIPVVRYLVLGITKGKGKARGSSADL